MRRGARTAVWITLMVLIPFGVLLVRELAQHKAITLKGAIIRKDSDPRKEMPIADVVVTANRLMAASESRSDASGFFSLALQRRVRHGEPITLHFRHPDYKPLDVKDYAGDQLYVAHLEPAKPEVRPQVSGPGVVISNVVARYSIKSATSANVGSAVKSFEIVNQGNVRCNGQPPCSPDGKWKAAIESVSLDAGDGNEFRNARASCIAGPCPFTKIESDNFAENGRYLNVSVRNWSDTATFLVEAEVFHTLKGDVARQSYPVIFGDGLNFTMPANAEGVTIMADVNGTSVIFPLGPNLFLSWASCNSRVNKDQTKVFRCALKPGYKFP